MIFCKLRIGNPWFRPNGTNTAHDYYWKDVRLSSNKNFEIQISKFQADNLLDIAIDLQWWGRDHAGPELDINVFGYMFNVKIYDSRHWNYDENRWMTDEEAKAEMDEWERSQQK
jgi:hypothetical protein